uniref:Uncharacterized protein n=1 Tax=Amphimedon queenslandica TaxID=400682 RepID=A0A1X7VXT0_AMPQE
TISKDSNVEQIVHVPSLFNKFHVTMSPFNAVQCRESGYP